MKRDGVRNCSIHVTTDRWRPDRGGRVSREGLVMYEGQVVIWNNRDMERAAHSILVIILPIRLDGITSRGTKSSVMLMRGHHNYSYRFNGVAELYQSTTFIYCSNISICPHLMNICHFKKI